MKTIYNNFQRTPQASTHGQDGNHNLKAWKGMRLSTHPKANETRKNVQQSPWKATTSKHFTRALGGLRPPRTAETKTTGNHVRDCPAPKIIQKCVPKPHYGHNMVPTCLQDYQRMTQPMKCLSRQIILKTRLNQTPRLLNWQQMIAKWSQNGQSWRKMKKGLPKQTQKSLEGPQNAQMSL